MTCSWAPVEKFLVSLIFLEESLTLSRSKIGTTELLGDLVVLLAISALSLLLFWSLDGVW